jgi:Nucleotidyltransferase of unknown function (DUF6036)
MRERVTASRLLEFMRALGSEVKTGARVYLVGGATAVLLGWRESTIDVDLKAVPDGELLKSLPALKEQFKINVELASPGDFIPEAPGWQERSQFIKREGKLDFFHYDLYMQALAKIERAHQTDIDDVRQMLERRLVDPKRLLELFTSTESEMYKYPAVDPKRFRRSVEKVVREFGTAQSNSLA